MRLILFLIVCGTIRAAAPEPAFEEVLARLRHRPGPGFAAEVARAEAIGRAQAERELLASGPDAARDTLERMARATAGSALGLAFERAASDLARSGISVPLATPPAVVLYWAAWAPETELRTIDALARQHPHLRMEAVALDEQGDAPERAFARLNAPANLTLRRVSDPWRAAESRALGLAERGVPLLVFLDPAGRVVRAGPSPGHVSEWVKRARP